MKQQHGCAQYTLMDLHEFSDHLQTFFCQALQWFRIFTAVNGLSAAVPPTWLSEVAGDVKFLSSLLQLCSLLQSPSECKPVSDTTTVRNFKAVLIYITKINSFTNSVLLDCSEPNYVMAIDPNKSVDPDRKLKSASLKEYINLFLGNMWTLGVVGLTVGILVAKRLGHCCGSFGLMTVLYSSVWDRSQEIQER